SGTPGSFDRTHHHPELHGWEPGRRVFDPQLSQEPLKWLQERPSDLEGVLDQAGEPRDTASEADVTGLRERAPEIVETVARLLGTVRSSPVPEGAEAAASVRASWL